MKRCDYCDGTISPGDEVSTPDLIGVRHYSKITCAENLKVELEESNRLIHNIKERLEKERCGCALVVESILNAPLKTKCDCVCHFSGGSPSVCKCCALKRNHDHERGVCDPQCQKCRNYEEQEKRRNDEIAENRRETGGNPDSLI